MNRFPILSLLLFVLLSISASPAYSQTPASDPRELVQKAFKALQDRDFKAVVEHSTQILAAAPKSAEFLEMRGLAYFMLMEYEKAVADMSQALVHSPPERNTLTAHQMRGASLFKLERWSEAIPDFDFVAKAVPDEMATYVYRGRCRLETGRFVEAVEDLTKALALKPRQFEAYRLRARANFAAKNFGSAAADATEAIGLRAGDPELFLVRAEAYRRLGQIEKSRADDASWATLVKDPWFRSEEEVNKALARAQAADDKDEFEDRAAAYGEIIRRLRRTAESGIYAPLVGRGRAYEDAGYLDAALADFDEALRIKPDLSMVHTFRGEVRQRQGNDAAAVESFNKAIAMNPKDLLAYRRRGESFLELGEFDKTIADMTKVLELDAGYTSAYVFRARAYFAKKDNASAEKDFSAFLATRADADVYLERAKVRRALGRKADAEADEKKAAELSTK